MTTMKKRLTLLARKEGMSASDFRHYWSGPHAKLALGMAGIAKYTQNRVDKVLWCSGAEPAFSADGIVELFFASDEAMRIAQGSDIGSRYIPEDEPNFLRGWTLCVVDPEGEGGGKDLATKVMVPFVRTTLGGKDRLAAALAQLSSQSGIHGSLDWTASTASRQRLWSEPVPPMGFVTLRFESVAAAHQALDEGSALRALLGAQLEGATAYLVDELVLR